MENPKKMNMVEVANYFNVSTRTVERWEKKGKLKTCPDSRRQKLYLVPESK
jgi:predicted site-specific integrase-resolvase